MPAHFSGVGVALQPTMKPPLLALLLSQPPTILPISSVALGKAVAFSFETLQAQALGKPHREAKDLKHQGRLLQQGLALPRVFGLDQYLQMIVVRLSEIARRR